MKVKNTKVWFDQAEKKRRTPKEEPYTISKERFDEINGTKFGVLVEEVIEEVTKETAEEKKEPPKKKK